MQTEPDSTSPLMTALIEFCRSRDEAAAKARKQLGVNELDAKALAYVGAHPGIRPSALAVHLGVTSAGVTTMVERLVRREILRRELDQNDRRVNHIHLAVDLEKEPWSQLARFDETCRRIITSLDSQIEVDLADFLQQTTKAANEQVERIDALAEDGISAA
ncbi:MarR family winged helix-turn-helix transcriptional regulator [Microbacterium sp. NPDC090007]|uniref:MarR family winged helix-turn-helix transcriptional regulator n=1 Tax=Microbacterium sp. NPDC090007 TaxID=3364204 RepID=UPI0037FC0085